jgi:hypothetical protein
MKNKSDNKFPVKYNGNVFIETKGWYRNHSDGRVHFVMKKRKGKCVKQRYVEFKLRLNELCLLML